MAWNISAVILLLSVLLITISTQSGDQFSWDDFNGTSYMTDVRNQNFPNVCNSGWALSSIDSLNSRLKIARQAASPDITLSAQVLLSCDELDFGCMGGQPITAFRWLMNNNITDQTCHSYVARGYTNGYGCSSAAKCQSCSNNTCKATPNSKIYALNDYGTLGGEQDMKAEIKAFGPIVCGVNSDSLHSYKEGIITQNSNSSRVNHYVIVYGWGTDEKKGNYWSVKNSWGPAWGEKGYFRIARGKNLLGIEQRCYWANFIDTWTDDIRNKTVPNELSLSPKISYSIPKYLLPSRNYQTPSSCEYSAAFSIIQMIGDRQSILSQGKSVVVLSAQALLNCGVGKCSKEATPSDILLFIEKYGLPQQGCQTYQAQTPQRESCTAVSNCATCEGNIYNSKCTGFSDYKRWKIRQHGTFSGVQNMKNQLSFGPIVCGIQRTKVFEQYQGGIFGEISIAPKVNHYVEIVGWGSENNKNYWLGRSMWGTSWGESSFFRMQMGKNVIGIESKCYYAKNLL